MYCSTNETVMAVLSCPFCAESKPTWVDFGDHVWHEHHPSNQSQDCPRCDYPLKKENITYHLPCFSSVEPETIWTHLTVDSGICPICGEIKPSEEKAQDHINTHSATEQKQLLGEDPICRICGEPPGSPQGLNGHLM